MSKKLVSNAALENIKLQDLSPVLREVTEDKQDWVYRYCDRSKIGRAVYEDFIKYNRHIMGSDDKFMFSIDMPSDGILSMSQAFQVIATTLEGFDLAKDPELGETVKQQVLRLFDKILDTVIQPDGGFKFDTTPYLPNSKHFTEDNYKYAYIDSMTWVISAILSMFRLHIHGDCEMTSTQLRQAKKVYNYCIKYLINSFIDKNAPGKFSCGWNYTQDKEGNLSPSLYFTFAVSELMIDILDTFENVIRSADIDLIQKEVEKALRSKASPDEINAKKEQAALRYQKERENVESDTLCYVRERELFHAVNDGLKVYDENSPYAVLENMAKKAVRNIWDLTKNRLANEFFTSDLQSTLSETVIEQSLQSDAVFNTIFIINALINAGLDEDADDNVTFFTANGSPEYEAALAEYDTIRDTLRIAYDNAYQFYLKMEKKKKAYKINEYTLSFDERFKALEEKVNDLRKARIRVFSLMPLLVKTKTTLGEFVIQYPQYDMQIYLENILNYRCIRTTDGLEEDYYWTWERGGYSCSSNYYFFSALNDFYNYYEKYEVPASQNALNNDRAREAVREEHLEELERSDGVIGLLRKTGRDQEDQIQALNEQLRLLEAKYATLQEQFNNDPLRKALNDFVCTVVREHLLNMASVGNLLSVFSENLTATAQARVAQKAATASELDKKTPVAEKRWYSSPVDMPASDADVLEEGLHKFGSALLSERLLELLYADRSTATYAQEDYPETAEKVRQDITQALRFYLAPLVAGQPSDYAATKGYSGLPQMIAREKANQKNGKNS